MSDDFSPSIALNLIYVQLISHGPNLPFVVNQITGGNV